MLPDHVDVLYDVTQGSDAEFLAPVKAAEPAFIPRAVPGDPELQAFGFTGRTDGTQLKPQVILSTFHYSTSAQHSTYQLVDDLMKKFCVKFPSRRLMPQWHGEMH
jgi:hypothetical protein